MRTSNPRSHPSLGQGSGRSLRDVVIKDEPLKHCLTLEGNVFILKHPVICRYALLGVSFVRALTGTKIFYLSETQISSVLPKIVVNPSGRGILSLKSRVVQ